MSSEEAVILDFLEALAKVEDLHREAAATLRRAPGVESVRMSVTPGRAKKPERLQPEYAEKGVTLALFLDVTLRRRGPEGQNVLGLSILLRNSCGQWIVEGELGWAGGSVGWDNFEDRQLTAPAIREIIEALPQFARELTDRYRAVVIDHLQR